MEHIWWKDTKLFIALCSVFVVLLGTVTTIPREVSSQFTNEQIQELKETGEKTFAARQAAEAEEKQLQKEHDIELGFRPPDGAAFLIVHYNGQWAGSVMDSGFDTVSHSGVGLGKVTFACVPGGTYSVSIQKQDPSTSPLGLTIGTNERFLDNRETTAPYGIVSLTGEC